MCAVIFIKVGFQILKNLVNLRLRTYNSKMENYMHRYFLRMSSENKMFLYRSLKDKIDLLMYK